MSLTTAKTAYADESSHSSGGPITIAGWSAAIVLTGSMNSVIPQGSLIVTQPVNPAELKVGDDITFLNSPTTSVTHRIIEVIPSYENTGKPAFVTKGVDNPEPDASPARAENVLGRVVFHSHALGIVFSFIRANWPLLVMLLIIFWGFKKAIKRINRPTDPDRHAEGNTLPSVCKEETTSEPTGRVLGYSMSLPSYQKESQTPRCVLGYSMKR